MPSESNSSFPHSGANVEGFSTLRQINSAQRELKLAANARTIHLTFITYERQEIFLLQEDAELILRIFHYVASSHNIEMYEACAMSDHVHLLVSFDYERHLERDIVKKLKGASARCFRMKTKHVGDHLWQRGRRYETIATQEQFDQVLRYIQENPKKENISPEGRILSGVLAAGFSPRAAGFIPQR